MCGGEVSELCFKPFWTQQETPGGHVTSNLLVTKLVENAQYPGGILFPQVTKNRPTQMDFRSASTFECFLVHDVEFKGRGKLNLRSFFP